MTNALKISLTKLDKLFAVGDWSEFSNVAELYLIREAHWQTVEPYPYGDFIFFAPVIGFKDDFYVFGGYVDFEEVPTIARFSPRTPYLEGTVSSPQM